MEKSEVHRGEMGEKKFTREYKIRRNVEKHEDDESFFNDSSF